MVLLLVKWRIYHLSCSRHLCCFLLTGQQNLCPVDDTSYFLTHRSSRSHTQTTRDLWLWGKQEELGTWPNNLVKRGCRFVPAAWILSPDFGLMKCVCSSSNFCQVICLWLHLVACLPRPSTFNFEKLWRGSSLWWTLSLKNRRMHNLLAGREMPTHSAAPWWCWCICILAPFGADEYAFFLIALPSQILDKCQKQAKAIAVKLKCWHTRHVTDCLLLVRQSLYCRLDVDIPVVLDLVLTCWSSCVDVPVVSLRFGIDIRVVLWIEC